MENVYPMDLPRNFHAEQMIALLKNVSLSVSDLIQAQKNPDNEYRYMTLRLSPSLKDALRMPEDDSVVSGENTLLPIYDLWGLNDGVNTVLCPDKATEVSGLWDEVLSNASIFLSRSGLTMKDFQEIRLLPAFIKYGVQIEPVNNTSPYFTIFCFSLSPTFTVSKYSDFTAIFENTFIYVINLAFPSLKSSFDLPVRPL